MKKMITIFFALLLTACSAPTAKKMKKPLTKRIQVTASQCAEYDDWYLDGYRTGKTFRTEKTEMLNARLTHCEKLLKKRTPANFKENWEAGYQSGVKH